MCRAAGLAVAAGAGGSSGSSRPAAPPLALWVKGPDDPAALAVRSVAIIGARAATDYGMRVAAELAGDLAAQGVAVVSGGAYGIDACAHRAALAAGGQTVLVSAAGLDRPYPAAHGGLYEQVARQGLLISESPPGDAPFRRRFLTRNRLIAAFGSGSVIVEAGWRSGALNTAAHARRLGRAVMAVPGPVGSAMSAGCHALLRREPSEEGSPARLVTCVADVLAEISASPAGPVSPAGPAIPTGADGAAVSVGMAEPESARSGRLREALDALSTSEGAVYDALRPRAWASEDELSVRSGVPVVGVRRALAALLVGGLAQDGPLGFRLAPASRPGAAGFEAPSPRGRGGQP
jgi:DNA processing protein